ncbi:Protein OS-9 [Haplosporangium sp. Z 27]|nr:Protein OS-9 [Haplosporangium sp. Z 27]
MRLTISLSKASILVFTSLFSFSSLISVSASSYGFVYNDLLAHPQYHVQCLDELVPVSDIGPERLHQGNLHHQQPPAQLPPQIETTKQDQSHQDQGQDQYSGRHSIHSNAALDLSTSMIMTDAEGQKWACTIPSTQVPVDKPEPEKTPEELKVEGQQNVKRGLELLDHLTGRCLLTNIGYWTYEYCHKKHIRQFNAHNVNGKWVPTSDAATFVLATYQPPSSEIQSNKNTKNPSSPSGRRATTTEFKVTSERKYLVQYWDYGDICDLNGAFRKVEVQFQCANVDDRIQLISEPSTCTYIMVIYSSSLCKDTAFELIPAPEANKIDCRLIVSDDYYQQRKVAGHGAIEDGLGTIALQDPSEQIKFNQKPRKDETKSSLGKGASAYKDMASLIDKVEAETRRKQLDDLFVNFETYLERLKPLLSKAQLDALQKMEDLVEGLTNQADQEVENVEMDSFLRTLLGGDAGSSKQVKSENAPGRDQAESPKKAQDKKDSKNENNFQEVFQRIIHTFDEHDNNAGPPEPKDEGSRNDDLYSSIDFSSLLEMLSKEAKDTRKDDKNDAESRKGQGDAKEKDEAKK